MEAADESEIDALATSQGFWHEITCSLSRLRNSRFSHRGLTCPTLLDDLRIFLAPHAVGPRNLSGMQPVVQFDGWQIVDLQTRLNDFQPKTKILSDAIGRITAQVHDLTAAQHCGGVVEKPDFRSVPLVSDVLIRDLLRMLSWWV